MVEMREKATNTECHHLYKSLEDLHILLKRRQSSCVTLFNPCYAHPTILLTVDRNSLNPAFDGPLYTAKLEWRVLLTNVGRL